MDPASQHEPESTPQSASRPSSDPHPQASRGADPSGRGPSEAYTTRPDFEQPKKARWPAALAAALALAAAGLGLTRMHRAAPAVPPAPAQQLLAFSQKDFDAATTQAAQALLAGGKAAAPAAKVAGPAPAQQAAYEIAAAPQELRQEIKSGQAGFYTFKLAELVDEGGDVYDISVDGLPILRVTTSPQLKSITIPIDASKPHAVTQTLVFARPRTVYAKNGTAGAPPPEPTGQASLTIETSEGEAASHLSSPGQSASWTTQFHGGLGQ